jgi:dienelactone hydrolase
MKNIVQSALLLCAIMAYASSPSFAGETVTYNDGETVLEGYWAPSPCNKTDGSPLVLVVHQWKGITDHEKARADMLASRCYNAFAIDMYGKDIRPKDNDEAGKQATKYKTDLKLARRRINAAMNYAKGHKNVDAGRIAIMGYCFGGTMALEYARSGIDIDGAVSFHGALATPEPITKPDVIKTSIQVHHGADDPMVPQTEVAAFIEEMKKSGADWSLTQYAHAVHAFTQKEAGNDPSTGVAYNEKADKRSWAETVNFLEEIFGPQ